MWVGTDTASVVAGGHASDQDGLADAEMRAASADAQQRRSREVEHLSAIAGHNRPKHEKMLHERSFPFCHLFDDYTMVAHILILSITV